MGSYVWLLSLSMRFSGFIDVIHGSVFHPFLWLNNIPPHERTAFLFMRSPAGGRFGRSSFLANMNNAAVNICVQVFGWPCTL